MKGTLVCLIFAIFCFNQAWAQLGSTDKITDDLTVFIGGDQTPSTGPAGNHITMYNLQEAAWSSFNWGCNGIVRQIKVVDESIYLAGDFDQCDNTFYGPLVKYDIPSGEFSSLLPAGAYWQNSYDETTQSFGDPISVRDFQLYKGKLYIVGLFAINFTATNELASNVAAVDIRTGQWKTFGAGLNGRVNSLWVQDEKTLLLVGRFTRSGYGETFNPDDYFTDPGFAVWHEDHFRYGTGYMSYTIPVSYNNFDLTFSLNNATEVFGIWRGVIQVYPNGDNLNVPLNTPEPERLTIVLAGNFPGGVLYQQDSLPWRRPAGGVWGGPVYRLAPFLEENAFFFGGAFDHVGAENITDADAVLAGAVVQWNFQLDVPRGGNSNPLPSWDNLNGGVSGGEIYGLSYISKYGLLALTGSFDAPYHKVTYYDLTVENYFPLGEGNEFSADLYAVAFSNTQVSTNIWSGLWDSPQLIGTFSTCVVGSSFYGGNGYIAFEGTISRSGRGVSGIFYTAGASEYPNRGSFGIVLSPDAMSFSGWLAYDGEMGRQDFTGSRLAFSQPDLLVDCMGVDYAEGGTLAGQWHLADDDTTILNFCLVGMESGEASSNENGARYYTGLVGFPGKTVQAQYWDGKGYGLVIFRQSSEDQMVGYWFSGDVRDLDPTADCIVGVTCGVDIWVRNDTQTTTDDSCHLNDYFAAWTGTWSSCGVFAGSNMYLRPDGTGLVHGAFLGGVLEGQIDPTDAYRMSGYWSAGGFDEISGVLRGTFDFAIDVGLPWLGRSFRGNFTINDNIDGIPFNNPVSFGCNTQRYSSLLPLPNPSFFQSPSSGATIEGIWRKPDGDLLYVCVVEPNSDTDATVVASLGKTRYYEGDAYTVTAQGIEYFTSYSSPQTNSRDTSTLNYWGSSSTIQGLSLMRRVSETLLEETWVQVLPNRQRKWNDLNINDCTPETCQLSDRGSNGVIYEYVGPVTYSQCSQANDLRGRRPGVTIGRQVN